MDSIDVEILAFQESFLYHNKDITVLTNCNLNLKFIFSYGQYNARDVGIAFRNKAFDEIEELALEHMPEEDENENTIWESGRVCGATIREGTNNSYLCLCP